MRQLDRFSASFFNRDFTPRVSSPWEAVYPRKYSRHANGGPKAANMTIYGDELSVWELFDMLRCPVKIYDNKLGKSTWWGIINDVTVTSVSISQSVSIEDMWNKIQTRYTYQTFAKETTWAETQDSIDTYGYKELAVLGNDLEPEQAEQIRDLMLAKSEYPQVSRPKYSGQGWYSADVKCIGFWDTADWQYYLTTVGKESHEEIDSSYYGREVGEDKRPECAQSFQLASTESWDAYVVSLRVRKHREGEEANWENFTMELCADNYDEPGTVLATVSLSHDNFDTTYQWIDFELPSPVTLIPNTVYWIKCSKEGAISLDECYLVDGDGNRSYPRGHFYIHRISTGEWYEKPMDMNFIVAGRSETTAQLSTMVSDGAQFLLEADLLVNSGVYKNQARDGQNTTLFEMMELLNMGTSNQRRMLATVLENRHVEIDEEPAIYAEDYYRDAKGVIYDQNGARVENSECPVGMWIEYANQIPSNIDTSKLIFADRFLIEQAEYIVATDQYNILSSRVTPVYPGLENALDG